MDVLGQKFIEGAAGRLLEQLPKVHRHVLTYQHLAASVRSCVGQGPLAHGHYSTPAPPSLSDI